MTILGYARVSTIDQDLELQKKTLRAAGCDIVRAEKASGTSRNGRTELEGLLEFLRPDDVLMVTRIDRLARSVRDLQNIIHEIRAKGAHLRAVEQPVNTADVYGKMFLDLLGMFAEFETNIRRERQLEGIAEAKAKGVYIGRKPSIDAAKVRQMKDDGMGATAIARALGIDRSSVYRLLEEKQA
jgi:DNA invertase Pin-like site-specific DNA recombinase